MQTAFFNLCGLFKSSEDAVNLMYKDIEKTYKHKGPEVIQMNKDAVKASLNHYLKLMLKVNGKTCRPMKKWEWIVKGKILQTFCHT